ncbi:hypothetical protein TanjilG_13810 [Lupinus angustifolius]|uniref:Uncharacterized protein n=1 Tax=Lupinus angustifolius TaxID=3871 RepID=A0A1J7GIM2_LUPAN|nr:PREDICTED: uncharacterized protein LOC109330871 [Lupinus angustifolius]OIV94193.1 hypothetical protein TanjilG_13810 [Lupinus angustifolius]
MKTSQSNSLKVFGEGEGVSSTLRLENGKRVRRPPAKYQSFLSVDIISNDHEQKPRRPSKAHLKPIVVPSAARSNDGGVPPPVDALELAQLPSNSIPIGSPKPRGRPKKNVVASPSIAGCSAAYGGGKKPVVARKPMKKSIGKPMGHPKGSKVAVKNKQEDIEADLREKIRYIQSKVRRSVVVLRTYFHMKSPVAARAAIHRLQNLGSMDINLPLREDSPLVVPIRNAINKR